MSQIGNQASGSNCQRAFTPPMAQRAAREPQNAVEQCDMRKREAGNCGAVNRDMRNRDAGNCGAENRDMRNRNAGNCSMGNRDMRNRDMGNRDAGNRDMRNRDMANRNMGNRDMRNRAGRNAGPSCDRRKAMMSVYEWGFVLVETALFLDTHPEDAAALEYYAEAKEKYNAAVAFFSENFGPLNLTSVQNDNYWTWGAMPLPWEMEA